MYLGGSRRGDRGDSSTIGVVLMVGIAVVLAAVAFGTFADIGSSNLTETPNVQFDVNFDQGSAGGFTQNDGPSNDGESFTVRHEQGDVVQWPYFNVKVNGTAVDNDGSGLDFTFTNPPTELSSGDSVTVENMDDDTNGIAPGAKILVTYENPNTDKSVVLVEAEVP